MRAISDVSYAFVRYHDQIERVATAILNDADEARDIAAGAYLKLIERGPSERSAVLPWLLTVARHSALNRVRDRCAQLRKEQRTWQGPEKAPFPQDGRAAALVRAALATLAERDRLALQLRHVDDLDYSQIAAALRTTIPQARIVVHRAAKRLRHQVIVGLASYHGFEAECVRAVSAPRSIRHAPSCKPCLTLSDEIAAIRLPAIAPSGPILAEIGRQIARLRDGARWRVPGRSQKDTGI